VRPDEALDEVLKQLARVVHMDFALWRCGAGGRPAGGGGPRAGRGGARGVTLEDPRLVALRDEPRALLVADAETEGRLALAGAPPLRSWLALPLLLEGDVVGLLLAGRLALDSFTDEELLRTKAVAFWAAAAIRRVQLLAQVRRYAALLEQVWTWTSASSAARGRTCCPPPSSRAPAASAATAGDARDADAAGAGGRRRLGRGLRRALRRPARRPRLDRRPAPPRRAHARRGGVARRRAAGRAGVPRALATPESWVGCLALLDPNGESPEDRLLEAYASRAAAAYSHASLHHGRS